MTCSYIQSSIVNMARFIITNIIDYPLFSLIFFPLIFGNILFYIYSLFPVIRPAYELVSFLTVNMVYLVYSVSTPDASHFPVLSHLFSYQNVWQNSLGYFILNICSFSQYFTYHSNRLFFSLKRYIRYMKSDHSCHRLLADTFEHHHHV